MGIVVNTAKAATSGPKSFGAGQSPLELVAKPSLKANMGANLSAGSACPVLNETMGFA
jgi:hypothetical protein